VQAVAFCESHPCHSQFKEPLWRLRAATRPIPSSSFSDWSLWHIPGFVRSAARMHRQPGNANSEGTAVPIVFKSDLAAPNSSSRKRLVPLGATKSDRGILGSGAVWAGVCSRAAWCAACGAHADGIGESSKRRAELPHRIPLWAAYEPRMDQKAGVENSLQ